MIHPTAIVESSNIGNNCAIWQFVIILGNAKVGSNCNINCYVFIENDVDDLVLNVLWLENNWLSQKIELAKYDHRFTWDKTHDQTLAVYQQLSDMG
ncbi:hypothetical protein HN451_03405 [archaeon]|nr:hypothetical protein [archaeon]